MILAQLESCLSVKSEVDPNGFCPSRSLWTDSQSCSYVLTAVSRGFTEQVRQILRVGGPLT